MIARLVLTLMEWAAVAFVGLTAAAGILHDPSYLVSSAIGLAAALWARRVARTIWTGLGFDRAQRLNLLGRPEMGGRNVL